jgi:putative glutamine amidotransferase
MVETRAPIIGITCSRIETGQKQRPPCQGQNQTYVHALLRAGAVPLLIPTLTDPAVLRTLYRSLAGLLFTGGKDVHPARYGEPLHKRCDPVPTERDEMELTLVRWAVEAGKPLLAICRGIQVLNVALGGSLYQDLEVQVPEAEEHTWYPNYPRNRLSHAVAVTPETRLARILGATSLSVNSMHHQAIKDLAPGLAVVAQAPDGVIEGVEVQAHPFAVGVQWHPEDLAASDPQQQGIFDALVKATQEKRARGRGNADPFEIVLG